MVIRCAKRAIGPPIPPAAYPLGRRPGRQVHARHPRVGRNLREQAELLPDQRWVQLISLTRPGLAVEPMWWDRLRASTIVAPGAAAVDLGLQVARAIVS